MRSEWVVEEARRLALLRVLGQRTKQLRCLRTCRPELPTRAPPEPVSADVSESLVPQIMEPPIRTDCHRCAWIVAKLGLTILKKTHWSLRSDGIWISKIVGYSADGGRATAKTLLKRCLTDLWRTRLHERRLGTCPDTQLTRIFSLESVVH